MADTDFKARITVDISQARQNMRQLQADAVDNVSAVRNELLRIGGVYFGGAAVKDYTSEIVKLGAEMQQTRVAFNVMLGSADRANAVLGDLIKFSDITPFEPGEVIKAGRALMAANVPAGELAKKLQLLGNISAGANIPLQDMVTIYAKAANKGKVQAEELNQMAERGIPILDALAKATGVSAGEILKMGEDGQLSFALLEDALQSLGGAGGKYFGLLDKQSQTLAGKWSTLVGRVKLVGTTVGELAIPGLTQAVDDFMTELERMRASGELAQISQSAADALAVTATALKDLVIFVSNNKTEIATLGFGLLAVRSISTVGSALSTLTGVLSQTNVEFAKSKNAVFYTSQLTNMQVVAGGLSMALANVGAIGVTAFAGWELGKYLSDMLGIEAALTRLMAGSKYDSGQNVPKVEAAATVDVVGITKTFDANNRKLKELKQERDDIMASGDPNAALKAKPIDNEIARVEKRNAPLMSDLNGYKEQLAEAQKNYDWYTAELKKLHAKKAEITRSGGTDTLLDNEIKVTQELRQKELALLGKDAENKRAIAANRAADAEANAEAELAAERRRVENGIKLLDKLSDVERKTAEERKKIKKDQQALDDDKFKDEMGDKIKGWRDEIKSYQKDVESAQKELSKMGLNVDDNILMTPEEIKQKKADDILQAKLKRYNEGKGVTFNADEQKRINELTATQAKARNRQQSIKDREANIDSTQTSVDSLESKRRKEGFVERQQAIDEKGKVLTALEAQTAAARAANAPLEKIMTQIANILKTGLPNETIGG